MTTPTPPAASADDTPRNRRRGRKPLVAVATLVVAAAAWFGVRYALADEPVHAAVGDCVHITGGQADPEVSLVPCAESTADYTVVRVVKNTVETGACNNLSDTALVQRRGSDTSVLCLNEHARK
ncbi:LppU/SCO3897 family protein [Peterkaempfera bronchialis]|uniref:LppU/SCO3897 family protein n=1 Tax=Peterkaempfera bronchialis TaxID=2126346 RepID=UPI003C30E28B